MPYVSTDEREVFVSRFNRVLAVLIWAASAALAVGLLVSACTTRRLLYLVPVHPVRGPGVGRCCGGRDSPSTAGAWIVVNVTRTIDIPWDALIHVDTKFALTLYTPGHRYAVWSAPAPGTASTLRATRNETKGRIGRPSVEDSVRRPGDLLSTESGAGGRGGAPPLGGAPRRGRPGTRPRGRDARCGCAGTS